MKKKLSWLINKYGILDLVKHEIKKILKLFRI